MAERPDELRAETVVPLSKVHAVIGALCQSHPCEEPAFGPDVPDQ